MKKIKSIIIIFLTLSVTFSCTKDDESAFIGNDNIIASFALVRGDMKDYASITTDSIIMSVSKETSLSGATAILSVSENARITPDPASVTNWDENMEFTVKSYTGGERKYKYVVLKRELIHNGNVTLLTQADVEEFAALKISTIEGCLNIATSVVADTIKSLAGLEKLKSIKYELNIGAAYGGSSLKGLENLETAGNMQIGLSYWDKMPKLTDISLPALKTVKGGLAFITPSVKHLDCPALVSVTEDFNVESDSLYSFSMPNLKYVGKNCRMLYPKKYTGAISFPALEKAGAVFILDMREVTSVDFPMLTEVTGQIIISCFKMQTISMPTLKTAQNIDISASHAADFRSLVTISGNASLHNLHGNIDFSSLVRVGGGMTTPLLSDYSCFNTLKTVGSSLNIIISEDCKELKGFESLISVSGDLHLVGSYNIPHPMDRITGLGSLTTVGGNLTVRCLPHLLDLSGLRSLVSVGGEITLNSLGITNFSSKTLPASLNSIERLILDDLPVDVVNIRGLGLKFLRMDNMRSQPVIKVIGDGTVLEELFLNGCPRIECTDMNEVKALTLLSNASYGIDIVVNGIKKVETSDMSFSGKFLILEDLEEVTGKLTVYGRTRLPKLKSVGSDLSGAISWVGNSMPQLVSVGGSCFISTYYGSDSVEEISLPKLTTIGGKLSIKGEGPKMPFCNTKLKNLEGLSSLTSVKEIDIQNNKVLTDYSGLKNALKSITGWNTSNNGYNPTYQDVLDGKFVKL